MLNKLTSLTSAVLLGLLATVGSATAADIYRPGSVKDGPYADPQTVEAVKWSGFYAAAMIGYGKAQHDVDVSVNYQGEEGPQSFSLLGLEGIAGSGGVLEGEVGYDLRLPNTSIVVGVLGGYGWSGIATTAHLGEFEIEQDGSNAWWLGGRVGVLINDSESALLYAKAVYIEQDPEDITFDGGSVSIDDRSGYGVGGGLEVAVRQLKGLYARVEYMHYEFDEQTYALGGGLDLNTSTSEDVGKFGLVYKIHQ